MKGKSIRNTPPLNNPLPRSPPPLFSSRSHPLHPVIFYSPMRGEFNKYMQMCAVEHDECKSGEDVLWALPRLRLRADPGLIIFHFPIAFNSAASARVCPCVRVSVCTYVYYNVACMCVHPCCAGGGNAQFTIHFVHMIRIIFTFKFMQNMCKKM